MSRRADPLPWVLAVMVGMVCTAWTPLSFDLGWILDFGREVVAAGAIPRVNHRTFLSPDEPLVMHEWLACLLFYGLHRLGGAAALVAARWVVLAATLALLDRALRGLGSRAVVRSLTLALAAWGLQAGLLLVRPQWFTILGLAWVVDALVDGRTRRLRWAPAVFLAWANLHGGWLAGLAVLAAGLVAEALAGRRRWSLAAGLVLAAAAATLVNPYGPELVAHTLRHVSSGIRLANAEWRPLLPPRQPFEWAGLAALLGAALLAAAGLRRRVPLLAAFLVLAWVASLEAGRNLRLAPVLLAPVVGASLEHLAGRLPPGVDLARPGRLAAALGVVLSAVLLGIAGGELFRFHDYRGPNPGPLLQALARDGFSGDLWADPNWGGSALWLLPEARVACDGRNVAAYREATLRACLALDAAPDPRAVLAGAGADAALLFADAPASRALAAAGVERRCARGACLYGLVPGVLPAEVDPEGPGLAALFLR